MSNLNVSRGTKQTRDDKKAILKQFVDAYQPNLFLSGSGYVSFESLGINFNLDIDHCSVFCSLNALVIMFYLNGTEMVFTITA